MPGQTRRQQHRKKNTGKRPDDDCDKNKLRKRGRVQWAFERTQALTCERMSDWTTHLYRKGIGRVRTPTVISLAAAPEFIE